MIARIRLFVATMLVLSCAAVGAPILDAPLAAADPCPHRQNTPPAVDESEVPKPGEPTPTPLAVHSPTVGGDRLADCGIVTASPAPQLATMAPAGWLIADLDSGKILAAKDPHGRYRPASTIKVLLALVALKELDLDKTVSVTAEDYGIEGDSCGTGPGGRYTIREMLIGVALVSGNDCANVLARELGGVDAALTKMNDTAKSLHAFDTRAASPSGLDAPGMSSSPYDLALIFRAAMANPTFRELISMRTYQFPGHPKDPTVPDDKDHPSYLMQTSCALLLDGYPGMIGGKTGFTDDARKTFVGAAESGGRKVVIVQMFGLNTKSPSDYWDQAKLMFDYGYTAPTNAAIGQLVGTSTTDSSTTTSEPIPTTTGAATSNAAPQHAASSNSDGGGWGKRILAGLIAALVAVLLAAAALSINKR